MGGGDGRDGEIHVIILIDLPWASVSSLISAYGIWMVARPGGTEPVPRADTWSSRSELLPYPLPPTWSSSPEEANLAVGRRRGGAWGSSLRARKGANREQEGGLQCLGAKFSSALFWVTTFTMFLHPESFRLPARLRCFQLIGFHTYLTAGLVQGLPSPLTAALQSPHC